jgi:hypothetical protein
LNTSLPSTTGAAYHDCGFNAFSGWDLHYFEYFTDKRNFSSHVFSFVKVNIIPFSVPITSIIFYSMLMFLYLYQLSIFLTMTSVMLVVAFTYRCSVSMQQMPHWGAALPGGHFYLLMFSVHAGHPSAVSRLATA